MEYDLTVIGAGPGGYVAAIRASQLGARVCVVEARELGGTCLNRGCIPTKALVASANLATRITESEELGITVSGLTVHWPRVMDRQQRVVNQLRNGIARLFEKNRITLLQGWGRLVTPNTVQIQLASGDEMSVQSQHILLATGSEPAIFPGWEYDGRTVVSSDDLLGIEKIPTSLIIIGGGVVGCEFASIFRAFGTRVTVIEQLSNLLPMAEREVSRQLMSIFRGQGIQVKTKTSVQAIHLADGLAEVSLASGESLTAEKVLLAVGRRLNTKNLGLEEIGVNVGERGEVIVNEWMETNIPGVYAVGDITNKLQLAHVASAQGVVAVERMFGHGRLLNYNAIPWCVFTRPEVAGVGLTSEQARALDIPVRAGKFFFTGNGKALAAGETEGFVKIIAHRDTDVLLGAHIIGSHASELIAEAGLAVTLGLTGEQFAQAVHAHPTTAEAVLEAVELTRGLAIHA
ncbi:MAG: dihydrolipoyl dehydrogenase [Firmicutes bacterium]|nr:dihydrolipoyl dehydrogenase [Bacillota bacterium]